MAKEKQLNAENIPFEIKFQHIFEKANDAILLMTEETFVECNPTAEEMFGCTREEIIQGKPYDFSPKYQPDGRLSKEKALEKINIALKGEPQRFEWRHCQLDGTEFEAEVSLNRIQINSRMMLQAFVRDITERKQYERQIAFQAKLLNEVNDAIIAGDMDFIVTSWNRAAEELYGWKADEVIGREIREVLPVEFQTCSREEVRKHILEDGFFRGESVQYRRDGARIIVEGNISLVTDAQGNPTGTVAINRDITQRKNAEESVRHAQNALEESEERYRAFIQNSSEGIWRFEMKKPIPVTLDPDELVRESYKQSFLAECNDAMARMYGFESKEDLIGARLSDILNPDEPANVDYLRRFFQNDFRLSKEKTREEDIHGELHYFENSLVGIVEDYHFVRVWGTQRDITTQKLALQALKESEEKFRALTETTTSAIFIYSEQGFHYVNNAFTQITGYTKEEVSDKNFWEVVHPDHKEMIKSRGLARIRGEEVPPQYEFKLLDKSGKTRWVDLTATPIDFNGKPAALGTAFDITRRKQGELVQSAVFQISEIAHTAETLDNAYPKIHEIIKDLLPAKNLYIALYDAENELIRFPYFVDEKTPEKIAETRKPSQGITEYVLRSKEPLLATLNDIKSLIAQGEIEPFGEKSVDWLGVPLNAQGKTIGVLAVQSYDEGVRYSVREKNILSFVSRQIAMTIERKRAESALAKERQQLAVTLRSIGDGVITTDIQGRILMLNRMAEKLTGWKEDEAKGRPLQEVFPLVNSTTHEPVEFSLDEVITDKQVLSLPSQTLLRTAKGNDLLIADSIAPLSDEHSNIIGAVLVFRDETEKYEMEREILKNRKLESVGTLAGGIAHDFNNILAGILGNISLAKLTIEETEKTTSLLENAERAAKRASNLTNQLLTFSKGGAPVKETASIAEIINESVKFALHGSNVQYNLKLADNLWAVEVDPGQIDQVINNIVLNADQAMPSGGTIRVVAENVTVNDENRIPPLRPGKFVKVAVTDNGAGIAAENLKNIFDPYFSTKEMGHGLGLATCHSIIQKHGGKIEATSELGVGTTMTFYLPAIREKVDHATQSETDGLLHTTGKVLLMDDDTTVLEIGSTMLKRLGFSVETAEDGDEAIRMYLDAMDDSPYDVIIMDLTIPGGKGGKEVAEELQRLDPDATMIVSSGYSTDPVLANYQDYGFSGKVAKPYSLDDLSDTLRNIL